MVCLVFYAVLIFYLSNLGPESIPGPQLFGQQDKVMHLAEYVPLGYLALKTFIPATSIGFLATVGFCLVYAASDELHQSFVPGREASVMDWTADASGILISTYFYYIKYYRSNNQ